MGALARFSTALLLAAPLSAAEFTGLPRIPETGLVAPVNAGTPMLGPLRPLELAPLLRSLASIPIIAPAPEAPPQAASFFQLDALTAALASPAPASAAPASILDSFWTGRLAAAPGDFLETPKPRQAATVADVVKTAWESPTGRRVLRAAEKLARKTGERVPVVLKPLGNNYGEFDYVERVLYLNNDLAASDIKEAAATLIHELVHVLQHTRGIPAESLEMELEAHVVSLRVLDELGVPPALRGGFSRAAMRELEKGPEAYAAWMAKQLPGKIRLDNADFDELADDLDSEASELQEKIDRLQSPAAKARAKARLAAVERDLAVVRSPAGRKRSRDFAAHVKRVVSQYTRRK